MSELRDGAQEKAFMEAITLFQAGQYKDSFQVFARLYNEGYACEEIMNILVEAYYAPNEEDIKSIYTQNANLLEQYPYLWSKNIPQFEALQIKLFPLSDEEFFVFDVKQNQFLGIYDAKTEKQMKYFFQALDKPLLIENEVNAYHLRFLFDNVRRSEDYAGDNHIYLYYDNFEVLSQLLQAVELEPLLAHQKFVFFIGEEQKAMYPIDFHAMFGIEYDAMTVQPLRMDEIKRMIFFCKHACNGASLIQPILANNPYIGSFFVGNQLLTELMKQNEYEKFSEWIESGRAIPKTLFLEKVRHYGETLTKHSKAYWCDVPPKEQKLDSGVFLKTLKTVIADQTELTAKQAFCAIFLTRHTMENGLYAQRISPSLFFDPHMFGYGAEIKILKHFEYVVPFGIVRNPISAMGSAIKLNLFNYPNCVTLFMMPLFFHSQWIPAAYQSKYCVCRFEDVKLNPTNTLKAVCASLMIPFDEAMVEKEDLTLCTRYDKLTTFNTASVNRDYSEFFSEFDLVRLHMFFAYFHSYFGYEAFDFNYYKVSKSLINELFTMPFKFEALPTLEYSESRESLRSQIQTVANAWLYDNYPGPILYPTLIQPVQAEEAVN